MPHFYKIVIEFETDRSLACDELEEIAAQATAMVEEPADRDGNDMDVSVKSVETAFAAFGEERTIRKTKQK